MEKLAKILDGKSLAIEIEKKVKKEIEELETPPFLCSILVGDDAASITYLDIKEKKCKELGIRFKLYKILKYDEKKILNLIEELNLNSKVSGILLQLPLPKNRDPSIFLEKINWKKDVDATNPYNIGKSTITDSRLITPVAKGIMNLFDSEKIILKSKNIVIIGSSNSVGKPIFRELIKRKATVTLCNKETKNLSMHTQKADILIVATGHKHLIKSKDIKDNSIVIDVGITKSGDKIYGDVDSDSIRNKALMLTTHPGGIGPLTISSLTQNIIYCYNLIRKNNE